MSKHTLTFAIDRPLDPPADDVGFSDPRLAAYLGAELDAEIKRIQGRNGQHIVLTDQADPA